jgi:hypothetical protein
MKIFNLVKGTFLNIFLFNYINIKIDFLIEESILFAYGLHNKFIKPIRTLPK